MEFGKSMSSLLDGELTQIINKDLIVSMYSCTPYHPDFVKRYMTQQLDFDIDLHTQIRGIIIS